jgi:predicted dienelactone hydrolase
VDVHVWYPADPERYSQRPKTTYQSTLSDQASTQTVKLPLSDAKWLTWTVPAKLAREAPIDPNGPAFPVIVFSHGSSNDPIDYADTLELIAARGFVVAAPYHVNNTQDDVRIDYANCTPNAPNPVRSEQDCTIHPPPPLACNDGRPTLPTPTTPPILCSRGNVPFNMADRVNDIQQVLRKLPGWFHGRVDVSRAGLLGHSRGTATVLAAAASNSQEGGSVAWAPPGLHQPNCQPNPTGTVPFPCWPLPTWPGDLPPVKAVMGLAIAAPTISAGVDSGNIAVPTLLVAGGRDQTSDPQISECVIGVATKDPNFCATNKLVAISTHNIDKAFVLIPNAVHRSFDSTYCDELQAAGASADGITGAPRDGRIDSEELSKWMSDAPLDRQTVTGIVAPVGSSLTSGTAMDYCSPATFTTPVDIWPLVNAITATSGRPDVPTTGLDTDQVKQGVAGLAAIFFGIVLKRAGSDGTHFTRYLAPK